MTVRTNIAFDLSIGAITGQSDLTNVIAGSVSAGVNNALTGSSLQKVQGSLNSAFAEAYLKGANAGLARQTRAFKKQYQRDLAAIEKQAKLYQSYKKKMQLAGDVATKKRLQLERDAVEREISQRQAALDRDIRRRENANEEYFAMLKKYEEQAGRSFSQRAGDAGENFASAVSSGLTLDNMDPAQLVTAVGNGIQSVLPQMAAYGGKLAAQGGMMGSIGSAMTAIAGSAAAIAGAAAAIAAIVAMFGAAYGQTKDFNKAILDGSSGLDMMGVASEGLASDLGDVRKAAINVTGSFRIAADEVIDVLNGLNKAGVTFNQMRVAFGTLGDAQEAYGNIAATTITQMQVFGQSVDAVGSSINFMIKDMGYGLQSINDAFVTMYSGAKLSGMAASDFYNAINEITSGMARMNFRLEDSVEMLLAMTEILGEDMAKEVATATGKFKEMGFIDRMKTVITSGEAGRGILSRQAATQGEELAESIQDAGKAFVMVSRGLGTMKDGKLVLDADAMGKLTGTALGALQNELGGALGTRAGAYAETARGARSGATLGQRAAAMANLDAQGEMAMNMASAFAVLGDRDIGSMENLDRGAFEEITGISGNMFEAYQEISNRLGAQIEQERGDGSKATLRDIAYAIAEGDMLTDEDRKALVAAEESGRSEMEKLARQQLTETTSISTSLKGRITAILESMNGFLEAVAKILDWGSNNEETKRAQRKSRAAQQISQLAIEEEGVNERLEEMRKAGANMEGEEATALKQRKADIQLATQALQRSQLTMEGKMTQEGGQALARVYGAEIEGTRLIGRGSQIGQYADAVYDHDTATGPEDYGHSVITGYNVDPELYTDNDTLALIAEDQNLSLIQLGDQTKLQEKTNQKLKDVETAIKRLQRSLEGEAGREALATLSRHMKVSEDDIFKQIKEGTFTAPTGPDVDQNVQMAAQYLLANKRKYGLEDFVYHKGQIIDIDPNDRFAMTKPLVNDGMANSRGGNTMVVNVNGGNPAELMRVLRQFARARGMA